MVKSVFSGKKIGMEKFYMNILGVGVGQPVGSRELESPENFLFPHPWLLLGCRKLIII